MYNSEVPLTGNTWYNFTLEKTNISTHPPILNALELYYLTEMSQLETDSDDVEAINHIKTAYNIKGMWQGDPCMPSDYIWSGLNCSFLPNKSPRIISLNVSSVNLEGEISANIYDLKLLQKLNLKGNNLNGIVPAD